MSVVVSVLLYQIGNNEFPMYMKLSGTKKKTDSLIIGPLIIFIYHSKILFTTSNTYPHVFAEC